MTAQVHEDLIVEGRHMSMSTCPPIPVEHPRIESKPPRPPSTACWRGYIGQWEIRDGRLYLTGFREGHYRLRGASPLPATWFSGILVVPAGEILQYVHMGFETVFALELQVEIARGEVVRARLVDNRAQSATPWQRDYRSLLAHLDGLEHANERRRPSHK